jgi:hypothetical protein
VFGCLGHKSVQSSHKFISSTTDPFHNNSKVITNERSFIMTATKTTSLSPVPKKTVKFAKEVRSAKFASPAAAAEKNTVDVLLQGVNTRRRFPRRGSKTPGMLGMSASRFIFDNEQCFVRENLESVSAITLMNALHLQ